MNSRRIYEIVVTLGIMLSLIGCFLPWGKLDLISGPFYSYPEIKEGWYVGLGRLAFFSSIFTVFLHLFFIVRPKTYAIFLTLTGGLITLACSAEWILEPGTLEGTHLVTFTVLYGSYVTLLGAIIVSTATVLLLILGTGKVDSASQSAAKI